MKDVIPDSEQEASNNKKQEDISPISYDILNQGSEIAARIDSKQQFVSVTPAFASLFGYETEELVHQSLTHLFPDEYKSIFSAAIAEAEELGRSEFESQAKRKDGSILFKKGVLIKGLDTDNSLIRFYYFVIDITGTELNKLKSLTESEKAYSPSIQHSPDMLIITDYIDGKIIDINNALLDYLKIEIDLLLDKNINELSFLNKTHLFKHISKLKKNKIALEDEVVFKKDSENLLFQISSSLYKTEFSDKIYVYTVINDVSKTKIKERNWEKERKTLKKNNNTLKVLNKANDPDYKFKNSKELLTHICNILVSLGNYDFCIVSLFEKDKQAITPLYYASQENQISTTKEELLKLYNSESPLDDHNFSTTHLLFNKIHSDKNKYTEWKVFCKKNNLASCLILPLKIKKTPIGVITVFSEHESYFGNSDISLLEDLANRILFTIKNFHQRSALKKANKNLVKSETKFKSAFGSAPVGMCICDEEATIFDSNQSLQDALKLSENEIIGLTVFDLIHDKDKEKLHYCFERLIKNKIEHFSLEICCKDSENNTHEYFCNCSSIIDGQNDSKHIIFHFQNISSRKMAERALQKSEERFRLLYNGMPSMFFTISRDKTIRSINKYGAKHLGYNIVELSNQSIDTIISTKHKEKNSKHIEECFKNIEKIHRWELQTKHKDNNLIWVRITARYIELDNNENEDFLYIVAEDISETQRLSEKLSYQATHDPLTGLNNRIEFERRLKNAMQTRSHNAEHALCYMDLDNFKIINDTSGHLAGDELLRQLSVLLKQKLRQSDVLARLGGDEFGILMENCSLKFARRTIENIRQTIEEFRFVWQDKKFTIGSSMGLVPITESFSKVEDILSAADAACYTAKDTGRNRIHIFFPNDIELNRKRGEMEWVSRINNALEEDRFVIYYQEIQPVTSEHKDIHIELLLRMQGDDGELIPPGAFLSSAERYNIINKIDRWVVETALKKLSAPDIDIQKLGQCNINLSGQSLGNSDFSRFLFKAISESDIPSNILCFEVTETAAIANLASAIRFIRALKIQGCSFALDDFGSGVSSFGYLKNLPVDYLKIDGAFVRDIAEDEVDFTMVKSINDIAQVMNKKTVAEFVETEEINFRLIDIGVDYVQGHNIHSPEPLENLIQRLKK